MKAKLFQWLVIVSLLAAARTTTAGIIINGGLETLSGDTFKTVLPGSSYAGWHSVGGGDIEFVTELTAVPGGFFGPTAEGLGCVDLNGIGFQGAISQTITNSPGAFYLLRFAMSGNPGVLGQPTLGDKTMDVIWAGTNVGSFAFQHLPSDTQLNLRWEYHEVLVTGAGLDELQFTSTTGAYNGSGPVIDDITFVRVLDPSLSITSQPVDQVVTVGETTTFSVAAWGTAPLSYQWRLNSTNIAGATAEKLVLTNVQPAAAGTYSVVVSNTVGTVTSSNATLIVNALPGCVNPPAGLVGWWRGENNALDQVGANNGSLVGNSTYGVGRVSQGFVFDGIGGGVSLGDSASLQLQDFTIEAWIKRASTAVASFGFNGGEIFAYGYGGYALGILDNGTPYLTRVGIDNVMPSTAIVDTNFHHLVVTKLGANTVFYVDGVAFIVPPYNTTYTFGSPAAIGVRGDTLANSFLGSIDEVSIYNRQLSAGEVQAIYNAGGNGKCPSGGSVPVITSQPATQTVTIGETATFSVTALGTAPLSFQWRLNSTNIAGATADSLALTNAQPTNAGVYSVIVSNLAGTATSSNATLTVNALAACVNPPAGLVGWWRGENNALDQVGANNGTLAGNTTFGAGRVSQGFLFDGSGDGVLVGNPASLQLQDFSIEAWIKRTSPSQVSLGSTGGGILSYGGGGYSFGLLDNGTLFLSRVEIDAVFSNATITDTNIHHVAVTKLGTSVIFYIDGVAYLAPAYNTTYNFATPAAIGARGDNLASSFLGAIDEVSVYNRPLSAGEVQAIYGAGSSGKCLVAIPPSIAVQPQSQTAQVAGSVTFTVSASGTPTLGYQWTYNGTNLAGANTTSLTLTNLSLSQAGNYAVVVTNVAGTLASSNAVLSVVFPPATVRLSGTNGPAGGIVSLPVLLVANGNENALGFSVSFNPSLLSYTNISLGSGAAGATLLLNTNLIATGKLGVALALPSDGVFAAGTQEVVRVDLRLGVVVNQTIATVSFGDIPIARELADAPGNPLAANYSGGSVLIAAAQFEGDVSPRPNGDRSLSVTDWVLAGRYAARLDYPTNATEFQHADCAPRTTLGDGLITITDWVQAGRYAAKLDPSTVAGGPSVEAPAPAGAFRGPSPKGPAPDGPVRQLIVADAMVLQGQIGSTKVRLEALGDENALGFSLSFDPAVITYTSAARGAGAGGAVFYVNTNQLPLGRLGFALSLPTGGHFAVGSQEVVTVNFQAAAGAAGNYPVALTQSPVPREVSDANAVALTTSYINGTVTVNPPPALKIGRSGQSIVLSWPLWATNFVLEQSAGGLPPSASWTNLTATVGVSNNENTVTLPQDVAVRYFRLHLR